MLQLLNTAGVQESGGRLMAPVGRPKGFPFASNRGFRLPGMLTVAMISVWSPALSATYFVSGNATGEPTGVNYQGDAPASFSEPAGDSAIAGAGFSGTASNLGGGSASASASIFIGDFTQFSSQSDLRGSGLAAVHYTARIVGPATNALIPVHVSMVASVGGLQILNLGPEDPDEIPIEASASADVLLSYADDLENVPALPDVIATNNYDFHFFSQTGIPAPQVEAQTDSFDGVVMMAPNEDIQVLVNAQAIAEFAASAADQSEKVSDSAAADPTFKIDDPAFADYTITGAPEASGPALSVPEPATWTMLLIGFGGMGSMNYWRSLRRRLANAYTASRRASPPSR
jgi:hypothetical protein